MKDTIENIKHFAIHIDKLEQSFIYDENIINELLRKEIGGIIKISDNITLIRSSIQPNYQNCFKVNLETDAETLTLGYLYWGNSNKWLNSIYFKIYNKRLYDNSNVDVYNIGNLLGLKVNRLPNIEIAVDFNFNVVEKIYELFKENDLEVIILNRVVAKDEDVDELLNTGKGTLLNPYKYKGFSIKGKDTHRLELIAYDKSLEIEKSSEKYYIQRAEGFDKIYRLEVKVNGIQLAKTLKTLGISWIDFATYIYEPATQLKIWVAIFDRLLRFRASGKRECENILDLLMADDDNLHDNHSKAVKHPLKRLIRRIRNRA